MTEILQPQYPILIVDDKEVNLKFICKQLQKAGINNLLTCQDSRNAMDFFDQYSIEIALVDLLMPHTSGYELLETINQRFPEIPVIIVTGSEDIEDVVKCIKLGAHDYIIKPVAPDLLVSAIRRAMDLRKLKRENDRLRQTGEFNLLKNPEAFSHIVTQNARLIDVFKNIEAIAPTHHPVLITGETGVGKELFARTIHKISDRKGSLISVNVAGLDDAMFSDTLFGHAKGAFTGANQTRRGLIERAKGGTIFLDEIGDLSMKSQVKLLRLLQEGEYLPLGLDKPQKTDARIIAATNKNLWKLQEEYRFREDLNYRLRFHHIHIPPLRKRLEDLPLLVDFFLEKASKEQNKKKPSLPKELFTLLETYSFPGNVRELQAMVVNAVSRHKSKMLSLDVFRSAIHPKSDDGASSAQQPNQDNGHLLTFHTNIPTIRQATRLLVAEAMKRAKNNQSIAAKILGISQPALSRRLKN